MIQQSHWRRAVPTDAGPLTALVRRAYEKYVPRIGVEPGPMRDDYSAVISTRTVWLVEHGSEVAAALVLHPQNDRMLVENIAVHPQHQGTGLGGRLLASAEHQARQAGLPVVRLYTHTSMTENIDFYQRRGYSIIGRQTQAGLPRAYLKKRLDQPTAADALGLSLILIDPPDLITTGRTTGLHARLHNASVDDFHVTCADPFRAALLDEETGDLVGGLWGFRTLAARTCEIPAGSDRVLNGQVEARRTSRGPTAELMAPGQYLLHVKVALHSRRSDHTDHLVDVTAPLHPVTVTTRIF